MVNMTVSDEESWSVQSRKETMYLMDRQACVERMDLEAMNWMPCKSMTEPWWLIRSEVWDRSRKIYKLEFVLMWRDFKAVQGQSNRSRDSTRNKKQRRRAEGSTRSGVLHLVTIDDLIRLNCRFIDWVWSVGKLRKNWRSVLYCLRTSDV